MAIADDSLGWLEDVAWLEQDDSLDALFLDVSLFGEPEETATSPGETAA
jgi:hypothetical protein